MSKNPLVPLEKLLSVRRELDARIARLSSLCVSPDSSDVGDALAWSLLFEYWPDLLTGVSMNQEDIYYNRYFWFRRYATLKQARDGYDLGLEQQVFQLLEQADYKFEPDWALIEQLDNEATRV